MKIISVKQAEQNVIITKFIAGRSVQSIAVEHDKKEISIKNIIRKNPYARKELNIAS